MVQLLTVTSILSAVTLERVNVFVELAAPWLALLTKNSNQLAAPVPAVNKTSPPSQATLFGASEVRDPTGTVPTFTSSVEPEGELQLLVK